MSHPSSRPATPPSAESGLGFDELGKENRGRASAGDRARSAVAALTAAFEQLKQLKDKQFSSSLNSSTQR